MGVSQKQDPRSRLAISEINVTPLVDVMLVLLIMFMVTAPLLQQGLQVNVPETRSSGVELNEDPFRIVVNKSREITIGGERIALNDVTTKITAILGDRKSKQVYVEADTSVPYGVVAELMAELRAAGVTQIGLITQPKGTGP